MRLPLAELLRLLWSEDEHSQLLFVPSSLSIIYASIILIHLVLRSTLFAVLGLFSSSVNEVRPSARLTLSMPFAVRQKDMDDYMAAIQPSSRVLQMAPSDRSLSPAHLCMLLSALTEPAMLLLVAKRGCPINGLGAVNVRNRFDLPRPDLFCAGSPHQPLKTLLGLRGALIVATSGTRPVAVSRGFEYSMKVELLLLDGPNGKHVTAFRQIFTILELLKRGKARKGADGTPVASGIRADLDRGTDAPASTVTMAMEEDAPSKWAQVCKDYNPIHTSSIAGRLFGFTGKIAHGNHVMAKALEALRDQVDEGNKALGLGDGSNQPIWMSVSFKRPVVVPTGLRCELYQNDDEETPTRILILQQEKMATVVRMGFLQPLRGIEDDSID